VGHNSTAARASAERPHASQGMTSRRRALLQSATTPARAQQHGGVRFCRALQWPGHNSTAARASAERPHASQGMTARLACASAERHHASQSTTTRRRVVACASTEHHGSQGATVAPSLPLYLFLFFLPQ